MWSYAVTSGGKRVVKHIHWVVTVMFASSNGSVRIPQWRCCELELNGLLVILKKWLRTHTAMAPQLWKCFLRYCFNAFSNLFSAVMLPTCGRLEFYLHWHKIDTGCVKLCQWRYASMQRRQEDWGGPGEIQKVGPLQNGLCGRGAPKKFWDFTCSEVCSGGSWGSFSCMHTAHIYLQVAVFD